MLNIYRNTGVTKFSRIFTVTVFAVILLNVLLMSGCSSVVSSTKVKLADNLSHAILNNDDLDTIKTGGPAYLLMIDGMLHDDPDNIALLRTAAALYGAYTAVFVTDNIRAQKLTEKSIRYAFHAACLDRPNICAYRNGNFKMFANAVTETDIRDVPTLFSLGVAWSGWIQVRVDEWNAISEIPRVETIMQRVVELDEFYKDGEAHMYLGIFSTLLPPALGGKPEVGRGYFERAMEISGNKNLMVKVMFARQYARMVFDRELHDRLLEEVIQADPYVPGYVLVNMYAQQTAKELLNSADDYF
ncbi:TRAP transporter TatT component family protein [Thermodesulfobacteriota bacterium]